MARLSMPAEAKKHMDGEIDVVLLFNFVNARYGTSYYY
jgi:hypothetical protein